MGQTEKAAYYNELKEAGVQLNKPYRNFTEAELSAAVLKLREGLARQTMAEKSFPQPQAKPKRNLASVPRSNEPDPNEMAGQRLNTSTQDEIIRVDDAGRQWIQEEVQKKGYAAPRGRRVLTYRETGTEEKTIQDGQYTETFEVAGQGPGKLSQAKITLPSYQAGIYIDPRYTMFKVHCYNGAEGFDLFDVHNYFGGKELVPETVKRIYVENVLCYDIRTVVMAIQAEYRHLQLTGKI